MDALWWPSGVTPSAAVVAVAYGFGWHGTPGRMHILRASTSGFARGSRAAPPSRPADACARRRSGGVRGRPPQLLPHGRLPGVGAAVTASQTHGRAPGARSRGARERGRAVALGQARAGVDPYPSRRPGRVELVFSRWKTEGEHADFVNADLLLVVRSYLGCALGGGGGSPVADLPAHGPVGRAAAGIIVPLAMLAGVGSPSGRIAPIRAVVSRPRPLLVGLLFWGRNRSRSAGSPCRSRGRSWRRAARFIRVPQRASSCHSSAAGSSSRAGSPRRSRNSAAWRRRAGDRARGVDRDAPPTTTARRGRRGSLGLTRLTPVAI